MSDVFISKDWSLKFGTDKEDCGQKPNSKFGVNRSFSSEVIKFWNFKFKWPNINIGF